MYNHLLKGGISKGGGKEVKLTSYVKNRENFATTLNKTSLGTIISNLQDVDYTEIDQWQSVTKPWKRRIRKIAHRIIGYDKIKKEMNNLLSLMKIMDAKINK